MTELVGQTCAQPDCLAPVYLDEMCSAHWRLLIGYAAHARRRDNVAELERWLKL